MKQKFSVKQINKQNKIKNTTTNVPEKYEINVKTRGTTNNKIKIKFTFKLFTYSHKFTYTILLRFLMW